MPQSDAATLNNKAFDQLDCGNKNGARTLFEQVCKIDSKNSEARMMIGVLQAEQGKYSEAEVHLRMALEIDPEYADAFYYLASVLQARGEIEAAVSNVKRAIKFDPGFTDASQLLATLQQAGDNATIDVMSIAMRQSFSEADVLLQQGRFSEAATFFETVTKQHPKLAFAWFKLAMSRGQMSQHTVAERCCREAIRLDGTLVEAHMLLASFLLTQGKIEEACKYSDEALRLDSKDINAIALAANIAKHMGNPEKSFELLSPILERGDKQINIALAFAMISKDIGREQQAIDLMNSIIDTDYSLSMTGKSNLHFNLGSLYDSIKQYDQAFFHYKQGNKLKSSNFSKSHHEQVIEKYTVAHSPKFMASAPRSSLPSQRPIFIIGMVRSGTSLVEQILASHPDIYGAGELADIYQISAAIPGVIGTDRSYPECLQELSQENVDKLAQYYLDHLRQLSPDAKRVIDKLPGNFMHLGLIELLFPDAHVIHCMRNPVDTCLSAYFQDFSTNHPYAYDLSNLGAYYKGYLQLMEHWRKVLRLPFLEINYEDLIADQEQVSRKLVDFCGLGWDERCLQFHKTKRLVRTASYDQVNRPLYKQSVSRWKNYESHLEPLLTELNI